MQNNDIAALMPGLAASPALYPQKLDLALRKVLLVRMTEMDYRNASFLDDRMLSPRTVAGWASLDDIEHRLNEAHDPKPLHFIFHAGHVGSTLLSRLLDETGIVLPLREPLALRTLADRFDHDHANVDLETFLKLWSRGFASNKAVILKATSSAERLGQHLLNARPQAQAVCLNLAAEPYLATILAGENSALDLNSHAPERMERLKRHLGEQVAVSSVGELAAMSWLAERLTQDELHAAFRARVLPLDFEELLARPVAALKRVTEHFALTPAPAFFETIGENPVFHRYSKATEYEYSRETRADILAQARMQHGLEIRKGLDWLQRLAGRHANVARALA
jgi:hypothetical protein